MENLSKEVLDQLIALGAASMKIVTVPGASAPLALVPEGYKLQNLAEYVFSKYALHPPRKSGTVKVLDAASFCEYYSLFHDVNSRVFADEGQRRILGVLDYHAAGENSPRWGDDKVELSLRHSEEWKTWKAKHRQAQTQADFAEFLEDNGPDIISPSASSMLEVARDLSATTDVQFQSGIRIQNGQVQLKYTEEIKGTYGRDQLEIPERFTISIPVFVGSPRVSFTARLRYRIAGGKLTFWYDLLRADEAEREAFLNSQSEIASALGIKIINGSPA